MSQFILKQTD